MREAASSSPAPRGECLRCRQPADHCWCPHLVPQVTRAQLVLLQHPREARNPVGTARMAHLSVRDSLLLIGVDFEGHPAVRARLAGGAAAVLYPAPDARDAKELASAPDPLTVFVIDGTWWQAQKIWRTNRWLRELPAYRLDPQKPSAYRIRAEPEPHCVSTLEAVSYLLDAIAGAPGLHAAMTAPLMALVDRQLAFTGGSKSSPRRKVRASPRPAPPLPPLLRGRVERALLFYGEGNGWPARERRPAELVQWLASRPATGERFDCLVEPPSGRSPSMAQNLRLSEDDFRRAVSLEEFRRRWAAFVRPDDVPCGWGYFPSRLLSRAGAPAPPHVDLRALCNERLRKRSGNPEEALAALGLARPTPWSPGRGGLRMAHLEALFEAVVRAGVRPESATPAASPV